jgi:PDZ domain-containing protein
MRAWVLVSVAIILLGSRAPVAAEHIVEVPVLVAIPSNERGAFEVMLMQWDQKPTPDPLALHWTTNRIKFAPVYLDTMFRALRYAMARTPSVTHTGSIVIKGAAYVPTSTDGPSGGAVMTVGFLALFKGHHLQRSIALTGTLEPDGRIGPVGAISDKVQAAAREGYRTVLVPLGQSTDPRWNAQSLAMRLNVVIREVATIEEAYEFMTGQRL